jgi:nucleotide-binding universal stress UspA family protein
MKPNFARILVPVDFSPTSESAIEHAQELAARFDACIELLHIVEDPIASGAWELDASYLTIPELLDRFVEDAERRLGEVRSQLMDAGITVETHVVTGTPARGIVHVAQEDGCDLIVMGTHGRTGLSHMLMGSVAERVIRTAVCPVLTVRHRPSTSVEAKAVAIEAVRS